MSGDDDIKGLDRTVVRVGEKDVEVTAEDVKAIHKALVDYLKQSTYEDRDRLLKWSDPAFIDGDGYVRVGLWLLETEDGKLFLHYRERPGELEGKAHRAFLEKDGDTWKVTKLTPERIKVLR